MGVAISLIHSYAFDLFLVTRGIPDKFPDKHCARILTFAQIKATLTSILSNVVLKLAIIWI